MTTIVLGARFLLAAVFAVAALGKLAAPGSTRRAVTGFGVPAALALPTAVTVVAAEALTAAALIPSSTASAGGIAALVLLGVFCGAVGFNLVRGRTPDCHCFGQIHSAPIGPVLLVRNAVLAGLAGLVVAEGGGPVPAVWWDGLAGGGRVAVVLATAAALPVAAMAVVLWKLFARYGELLIRVETLEAAGAHVGPGTPAAGVPAPEFELAGLYGETTTLAALRARRRPVLLLFTDPRCGTCASLYPDMAAWQRRHEAVFTLTVVSRGAVQANLANFTPAGISGVLLQRDNEVARAYGITGTPSGVLVAPDGRLASGAVAGAAAIRELVDSITRTKSAAVGLGPTHHHGNGPANGNGNSNGHGNGNSGVVEPTASVPARQGQAVPEVQLPALNGQNVDLALFRGRELVLVFWNPLCGFCQRLEPQLRQWESRRHAESRLMVIITAGTAAANQDLEFASTVLVDEENSVAPRFGANGTPMAVLVDAEGRFASDIAIGGPAVMDLIGSPARSEIPDDLTR